MQAKHIIWKGSSSMRLEMLYKQLSGNDSFETPQDRLSVHLDTLEKLYPGNFSDRSGWGVISTGYPCGAISLFYKGTMEKLSIALGGSYYVACEDGWQALIVSQKRMSEKIKDFADEVVYFYNAESGKFALV